MPSKLCTPTFIRRCSHSLRCFPCNWYRGSEYPSMKRSVTRNTFLKGLIMNDTESTCIVSKQSCVYNIIKTRMQIICKWIGNVFCLDFKWAPGVGCKQQEISCRKGEMLNHSPHGSAPHQSGMFPTPAEFEWQELSVRDTVTHLHGLWAHPFHITAITAPRYPQSNRRSDSHCIYWMSNSVNYMRV